MSGSPDGPGRRLLARALALPKRGALEILRRVDPIAYARLLGVRVGADCKLISTNFGSEPYLITLGQRVEITAGVRFITHDGGVWSLRDELPELDVFGPIVVEDHVFVGVDAILMPGVRIGARSVVAAGSVVTKDVPPGVVVAGVPARVISTLEAYRTRSLARSLDTKGLSPEEKRRVLLEHFRREG